MMIASLFENKLGEYNLAVETITTITIDQEEELWISKCTLCLIACEILCHFILYVVGYERACAMVASICGPLALIYAILCVVFGAVLCFITCHEACKFIGFC